MTFNRYNAKKVERQNDRDKHTHTEKGREKPSIC